MPPDEHDGDKKREGSPGQNTNRGQHHAVAAAYKGGHLSRQCAPSTRAHHRRGAIDRDDHTERIDPSGQAGSNLIPGGVHENRHPLLRQTTPCNPKPVRKVFDFS
jgi:hypothetical protein